MVVVEGSTVLGKAIPALVASLLKPIAESVAKHVTDYTSGQWELFNGSLSSYLKETRERHKFFSSEVFANQGKLLEDYYLPLTLIKEDARGRNVSVRVKDFPDDLFAAYKDVLVIDTAGMGKSTLLKYMFLKQLEIGGSIPVFVELRRISKSLTLVEYILKELDIGEGSVQHKFFTSCLNEGVFTFYFDGFDEVSDDDKRAVSDNIVALKNGANNNHFIISSRQERSLASLAEFHRFHIRPLNLAEAYDLIRLLSPSLGTAESLIEKIDAKQHNLDEFLKNPLLVSLLVKSYIHSPILPVRVSEFYRQVFDALYQSHDAQKELWGFSRKKSSGLDLDRFHKAMRALGYLSYKASKLEFKRDELLRQIEDAKALTLEGNYSATSFEDDLLRAVPLFVQEGFSIRWAHRSLQEYFAASYICTDSKGNQEKILHKIYEKSLIRNANILKLCADIDEKTFKQTIVKRYLKNIIDETSGSYSTAHFSKFDKKRLSVRRGIHKIDEMAIFMFAEPVPQGETFDLMSEDARDYLNDERSHGFWEIDAEFRVIPPDDPHTLVKYLIFDCPDDENFLPALFEQHYGVKIWRDLESCKLKVSNLVALMPGILYCFDDNPSNPVNSLENFNLLTDLLGNLKRKILDVDTMSNFLEEICAAEANAAALEFDFD